jgi:hypothetical protein
MKLPLSRPPRHWMLLAVGIATLALVAWGCSKKNPVSSIVDLDQTSSGVVTIKASSAEVQRVMNAQLRNTPALMRIDGVVGTGTGASTTGQPIITVYSEHALGAGRLPAQIDGIPVVEEVTGKIIAMKGGGGGVSHTAKQTPPIQLGTSGSPALDIANGFCCGGTLGSLVTGGGKQYILSNSHVFAGDVVSGGNGRVSTIGDDIIQPGLIDVNCSAAGAQVVADLSTGSTLFPPNSTPNIDAALAEVRAGMVRTDGSILEIGVLSHNTVAASVGQAVKKSGRTTGLTRSTITGLNATISVGYSDECAGSSFTKTFTGQIIIRNRSSRFLNSGDSGSLMVEDVATNPRAVGLLYAGSSTTAVAQPINSVLSFFGVTMVGN